MSNFVRCADPERKHGHLGMRILIFLHMKCWKRMGADVLTKNTFIFLKLP